MAVSTLSEQAAARPRGGIRPKYVIGGLAVLGAIVYLIATSAFQGGQYFLTIAELKQKAQTDSSIYQREVRTSGAVLGSSIAYDPANNLKLTFTMVNIPADQNEIDRQGGLAKVLDTAVKDPAREQIQVVYYGPKPDLLKDAAQAIVTGKLGQDGVFYANSGSDGLLLKCPTRYDAAVPQQAVTAQP